MIAESIKQAFRKAEGRKKAARELYYWYINPRADNFTSMLYGLITKADDQNRTALFTAFPNEVVCYLDWCADLTSDKFFREEGVLALLEKEKMEAG